jgi:transcriptional regulator with XRE-family HTH domain
MPSRRRAVAKDLTESIAERLARIRKQRGITQTELADYLGISQSNVSLYERGELRLHGDVILKLTKILNVSADELLGAEPARTDALVKDRRFLRRLAIVDQLPRRDKDALLRILNAFIARTRMHAPTAAQ